MYIGMAKAPSTFNVKEKLEGPAGSYLSHIASQTHAKVFLRGKGSGYLEPTSKKESYEALHIYISHSNQVGLESARKLCESLIQTVQTECDNFVASQQTQQPLGFGGTAYMRKFSMIVCVHVCIWRSRERAGTETYLFCYWPPITDSLTWKSHSNEVPFDLVTVRHCIDTSLSTSCSFSFSLFFFLLAPAPYVNPYHHHYPPYHQQGPMQGPPHGPLQGPLQGPPHGPPQGPMQGPPQGPLQGPPHGPPQGPPHGPPEGPHMYNQYQGPVRLHLSFYL